MSTIITNQASNSLRKDVHPPRLDQAQLARYLAQPIEHLPLNNLAVVIESTAPDALDQSLVYRSAIARVYELFPDELKPGRYHGHDPDSLRQLLVLDLPHTRRPLLYAQLQTHDANEEILEALLDRFTPALFTFPAAHHMKCTDSIADHWDDKVLQPALANNGAGLGAPLETLERIKTMPWLDLGLCEPCFACLCEEWTSVQRQLWDILSRFPSATDE